MWNSLSLLQLWSSRFTAVSRQTDEHEEFPIEEGPSSSNSFSRDKKMNVFSQLKTEKLVDHVLTWLQAFNEITRWISSSLFVPVCWGTSNATGQSINTCAYAISGKHHCRGRNHMLAPEMLNTILYSHSPALYPGLSNRSLYQDSVIVGVDFGVRCRLGMLKGSLSSHKKIPKIPDIYCCSHNLATSCEMQRSGGGWWCIYAQATSLVCSEAKHQDRNW